MLAGLLRHPSLSVAVTGICLNLMALVYMMSFGFSGEHPTDGVSAPELSANLPLRCYNMLYSCITFCH